MSYRSPGAARATWPGIFPGVQWLGGPVYNYLVWIILGAVVGAAFGLMRMRNEPNHDMTLDVFYGVIAAGIGGMLLSPLLGMRPWGNGDFSVAAAITAGLTALLALAGVVFMRHRAAR